MLDIHLLHIVGALSSNYRSLLFADKGMREEVREATRRSQGEQI
jgi:hypothetical protein